MPGKMRKIAGTAAALALLGLPASAIASTSPTPTAQAAASNWAALSAMSSAGTTSAATLAAVQGDPEYRGGVSGIPLPVIGVFLATIGVFIWILTQDDDDDGFDFDGIPISPG